MAYTDFVPEGSQRRRRPRRVTTTTTYPPSPPDSEEQLQDKVYGDVGKRIDRPLEGDPNPGFGNQSIDRPLGEMIAGYQSGGSVDEPDDDADDTPSPKAAPSTTDFVPPATDSADPMQIIRDILHFGYQQAGLTGAIPANASDEGTVEGPLNFAGGGIVPHLDDGGDPSGQDDEPQVWRDRPGDVDKPALQPPPQQPTLSPDQQEAIRQQILGTNGIFGAPLRHLETYFKPQFPRDTGYQGVVPQGPPQYEYDPEVEKARGELGLPVQAQEGTKPYQRGLYETPDIPKLTVELTAKNYGPKAAHPVQQGYRHEALRTGQQIALDLNNRDPQAAADTFNKGFPKYLTGESIYAVPGADGKSFVLSNEKTNEQVQLSDQQFYGLMKDPALFDRMILRGGWPTIAGAAQGAGAALEPSAEETAEAKRRKGIISDVQARQQALGWRPATDEEIRQQAMRLPAFQRDKFISDAMMQRNKERMQLAPQLLHDTAGGGRSSGWTPEQRDRQLEIAKGNLDARRGSIEQRGEQLDINRGKEERLAQEAAQNLAFKISRGEVTDQNMLQKEYDRFIANGMSRDAATKAIENGVALSKRIQGGRQQQQQPAAEPTQGPAPLTPPATLPLTNQPAAAGGGSGQAAKPPVRQNGKVFIWDSRANGGRGNYVEQPQ